MKKHVVQDRSEVIIKTFAYVFVSLFALCCLLPLILIVSASFSDEMSVTRFGFSIFPRGFTVKAYTTLFGNVKALLGSYAVTIALTVSGTSIGLFLITMTGYALQRPDFHYRNHISFFIYFTTLFSGGVVPFYLLIVQGLHLQDNYLAILLPSLMSPWYIVLMKNFMKGIPHSITESAKIDGASDFSIFFRLIIPLAKPGMATVGLFLAIGYWNEWYNSMLFLSPNVKYQPLQLFLYSAINKQNFIRTAASHVTITETLPLETMKMAIAVVSTVPIILVYPFIQRYFIAGITIGAVKG